MKIMNGIYCDSAAHHLETENDYLNLVIKNKDTTITTLESKVLASEEIKRNLGLMIGTLKEEVMQKEQSLKKQQKQKRIVAVVLGVVLILVII